jgi:PAS domain S-box-containing protein
MMEPLSFSMPASPDQPDTSPRRLRGPWGLALAVLLVSVGATLIAWKTALDNQQQRDQARVARFVGRTQLNLQHRLGRYEDIVRGGQGFFTGAGRRPSPEAWRDYVSRLDLPGRHPGLTSLAYISRVDETDLASFFASRPQLVGKYHRPVSDPMPILEGDQGGDHLIIELCEPGARAALGLGLDVGTSRTQRLAAERAMDTGQPALSGLLYFTRPEGRQDAVALYMPVYGNGGQTEPLARRQNLRGWVSAGILIKPLMEDILRGEDPGVALEVVDAYATQGPQWLYSDPEWPVGARADAVRMLDLGGRGWELRYAIKPGFYKVEGRGLPLLLLVGGVIISGCLAAVVWSLAGTRRRAVDLARSMNASLFEALQRNRSHLAYTPLAVIETDAAFRIREWNKSAERIFGYTREEALGQDPRMLVPADRQEEVAERRQALFRSESGNRTTLENVTRTGQRIFCDWYNTALRDESGAFLGGIFLADDITERQRAEGALRQAQKLESLGVLAGGIAHDFNNLLTAILGNTEVALERASGDPALRAALQRIEATTQRGSDLARQLLAYAGKAHFAVRSLDLNAIILEMGDLLSVSISKKVSLRQDLQPGLPPVEADSAQFQQVIMNLVINASEAIGDQPGQVILRTRSKSYSREELSAGFPGQVLEPGPFVRMEVEDDGCGMDAETIGRIFDPFFTTKFTGRGLGLSAMLGIVRGHRAGIRVESTPGEGTIFTLLFPASESTVVLEAPEAEPARTMSGTVLVVDDESIIRDLARSALEGAGFRVLEARDGLEAVAFFEAGLERADLVLLDMTMPRMGGADAFRRIRSLAPEVRVLLTSGYTQKEALESLVDLPPDGFLPKPFRIRELVAKVREMLRDPVR